jgi:homoserine kinase
MKKIRVRVPATSANLGPGYDVLGLALSLYNEVDMQVVWDSTQEEPSVFLEIDGEGKDRLPPDQRNITAQAALAVFKRAGKKPKEIRIRQDNRIPLASGLGSSAAACVGALLAANVLAGKPFSQPELVDMATELEGHPDNAVPAFMGGLCISLKGHGVPSYHKITWPKDLLAVICIPELTPKQAASLADPELKTYAMRALLSPDVKRQDAIFNIGRTSLLIAALLEGDYSLLAEAMQDRLHQPKRFEIFKVTPLAIAAALKAGAYGAALSGAGPGILALSHSGTARRVANAMEHEFKKQKRRTRVFILNGDVHGAKVTG